MELTAGLQFVIRVKFNGGFYRYTVKLVERTDREEVYHVTTRTKTLVFRNNRPFFRNRGLKYRRPDWTTDAALLYDSFTKSIISEIDRNTEQ